MKGNTAAVKPKQDISHIISGETLVSRAAYKIVTLKNTTVRSVYNLHNETFII
jgi:hypothetical protein